MRTDLWLISFDIYRCSESYKGVRDKRIVGRALFTGWKIHDSFSIRETGVFPPDIYVNAFFFFSRSGNNNYNPPPVDRELVYLDL